MTFSIDQQFESFLPVYDVVPEKWEDADEDAKLELIRDCLQYNTSVVCCEDDCIVWMAF